MPRTLLPAFATTVVIVLGCGRDECCAGSGRAPDHPTSDSAYEAAYTGAAFHTSNATRLAAEAAEAGDVLGVQIALQHTPTLASAVMVRLPAGVDLMEVSAGFQDLGQFVAAVNASRTLGIPMRDLKRRMVADRMPLLLALQDIRPKSNYRAAARRAEEEAAAMMAPAQAPTLTLATGKG